LTLESEENEHTSNNIYKQKNVFKNTNYPTKIEVKKKNRSNVFYLFIFFFGPNQIIILNYKTLNHTSNIFKAIVSLKYLTVGCASCQKRQASRSKCEEPHANTRRLSRLFHFSLSSIGRMLQDSRHSVQIAINCI
jgi:hypothetical protein